MARTPGASRERRSGCAPGSAPRLDPAGEPDRQGPAAGRGDGRQPLALGHELMGWRGRPPDLLVEARQIPPIVCPADGRFLAIRHALRGATGAAVEPGELVRRICGA